MVRIKPTPPSDDKIHPPHYGDGPYEAIRVIDAWDLGFCLGTVLKYVKRASKKSGETRLDDLLKARWYLQHEIDQELQLLQDIGQ
jgi:hypothetical protein